MCSNSANRRNVLRAVREGGITGVTMFQCATCVVARLNLHPSCNQKVLEILFDLERDFRVQLEDAVLMTVSEIARQKLLRQRREAELSRRRTLRRTSQHRSHGIRGLTPLEPPLQNDPDWDPDAPSEEELDFALWASQTGKPTSPAGGWAEDLEEYNSLVAAQLADLESQDKPHEGCCGSAEDLAAAYDERQLVS